MDKARWNELLKEDFHNSFAVWERHEAMSVIISWLITAPLSYLATVGIIRISNLDNIGWSIAAGVIIWFVLLLLIITPIRMLKARADTLTRLTTKRLVVSLADNYEPRDGYHWLRLRVDNPSSVPIAGCYGKLASYTMLIKVDGVLRKVTDFPDGSGKSLNNGLPPERHPFPWASTNTPDTLKTIAGNDYEYLYIAVMQENSTNLFTPTEMGLGYPKTNIFAEYEVIIDIGSEVEQFSPTKVCLNYAMTQHTICAKRLEILTD